MIGEVACKEPSMDSWRHGHFYRIMLRNSSITGTIKSMKPGEAKFLGNILLPHRISPELRILITKNIVLGNLGEIRYTNSKIIKEVVEFSSAVILFGKVIVGSAKVAHMNVIEIKGKFDNMFRGAK